MGLYFRRFDSFVEKDCLLQERSLEGLVNAFEASSECPVFPEYVLYDMEQRVYAARQRYFL